MATQDYTKVSTFTTADGKRTAELDYQNETLTVFEGSKTLGTVPMSFEELDTISMFELADMVEGFEALINEVVVVEDIEDQEEEETEQVHECSEEAERKQYIKYISDGLASTDGHYAPESFKAWQSHYHRAIGYKAPETDRKPCTSTECNAPKSEQRFMISLGRKKGYKTICKTCSGR